MKIYEEKDEGKRTFQCSYCWNNGHNKRACSHLKAHYLANKDWGLGNMPIVGVTKEMFSDHYQKYHGDARAEYQFRKHFVYAEKLYGDQAEKTPKKRKKIKCGFCKQTGHTRRNCSAMTKFVKILTETERGYRTKFYDEVIVGLGFGLGSFIEYGLQTWQTTEPPTDTERGLVTSFDPSTVSIGNLQPRWGDYYTTLSWRMDGKEPLGTYWGSDGMIGSLFAESTGLTNSVFVSNSHSRVITNIMAPSPTTPDKDWFLGKSASFDWVVKKRDLRSLYRTYHPAILEFHPDGENIIGKLTKKLDK